MFSRILARAFCFPALISVLLLSVLIASCTENDVDVHDGGDVTDTPQEPDAAGDPAADEPADPPLPDAEPDGPADAPSDGPDAWEEPEPLTGTYWSRLLATGSNDEKIDMAAASDGGFFVAGLTDAFLLTEAIGTDSGLWVIRLDSRGNVLWQKTDRTLGFASEVDIEPTTGGGVVGCASVEITDPHWYSASPGWHFAFKMSDDGTLVWQKLFVMGGACCRIRQTPDNGYVMAADVSVMGTDYDHLVGDLESLQIVKLDFKGDLMWVRGYNLGHRVWPSALVQTSDSGFMVAAQVDYDDVEAGMAGMLILKTDQDGAIEWQRSFSGEPGAGPAPGSIMEAREGGYMVAAQIVSGEGSDFLALRLEPDGTAAWHKTLHFNDWDFLESMMQNEDGSFVLAGYTHENVFDFPKTMLVKMEDDGEVLWSRTCGGWDLRPWSAALIPAGSEGFVLGSSAFPGERHLPGFWIMRLDGQGLLPAACDDACSEAELTLREWTPGVVEPALTQVTAEPGFLDINLDLEHTAVPPLTLCSSE